MKIILSWFYNGIWCRIFFGKSDFLGGGAGLTLLRPWKPMLNAVFLLLGDSFSNATKECQDWAIKPLLSCSSNRATIFCMTRFQSIVKGAFICIEANMTKQRPLQMKIGDTFGLSMWLLYISDPHTLTACSKHFWAHLKIYLHFYFEIYKSWAYTYIKLVIYEAYF